MRRPCRESFSGRGGFYIISDLVERIVNGNFFSPSVKLIFQWGEFHIFRRFGTIVAV